MMTPARRIALVALVGLAVACTAALLAVPASAGGGPPANGDWTVDDTYVLEDRVVMLRGNLTVVEGGDLTVSNSTIIMSCAYPREHGMLVLPGGTMRVLDGSVLTSSRSSVQWTWCAEAGSTLVVRGSIVKWCGVPAWGTDPENPPWKLLGLCVLTPNATIEDSRFERGFIGICFPFATAARPVRNCSFENHYGIVTQSTDVVNCTFGGLSYRGVWLWWSRIGRAATLSECTFTGMRTAGVHVLAGDGMSITGCTFKGCSKGIWVDMCTNLRVEGCTFDGMMERAIHVDRGSVHVVDGVITDTPSAFWLTGYARLDWRVQGESVVSGADVMVSDDLVLGPGASLRLLGCRSLAMLSSVSEPLSIELGEGAVLEMSNTSIEVPEKWYATEYGAPVRIHGPGASLRLVCVDRLDVSFPVELGELRCRDAVLPLGGWNVSTVHLEGCTLVADPHGSPAALVVTGPEGATASDPSGEVLECNLDGIPRKGPSSGPWLSLMAGRLRSVDFLSDLQAMVLEGELGMPDEEGLAAIEAAWSMNVEAYWQNGRPAGGTAVHVTDRLGSSVVYGTDANGKAHLDPLTTEIALSASDVTRLYPFTVTVEAPRTVQNVTVPEVTSVLTVIVVIHDSTPPVLSLDQGDFVGTRVPDIRLSGMALDGESGIAFLQARLDGEGYVPVPVGADGTFELRLRVPTGLHGATLQLYDQAGNRAERRVSMYHATQPPKVFSVEPPQDTLVNTTLVMLAGETERNVTVESMGRSQLTTNGTFRLLVPLVEGENRLALNFTDLAGNRNSTTVRVFRDTVPPVLSITSPASSPLVTSEPRAVIEGSSEVGSKVLVNSVEFMTDAGGRFSVVVSLTEGESSFTILALDAAGNSRSTKVAFVLDSTPPSLRVLWPPEGVLMTRERTVTIELEVDTDASFTLNGTPIPVTGSPMRVQVNLTDGENPFVLRATDALGNSVEVTRWVTSHWLPPALAIDPAPPSVVFEPIMKLTGGTEPGARVTVNSVAVTVDGEGRFQLPVLLARGTTQLTVESTDAFGNSANVSFNVTLAPVPPDMKEPTPSMLPSLLLVTFAVLVAEGVMLLLWARRRHRLASRTEQTGGSDTSSRPRRAG